MRLIGTSGDGGRKVRYAVVGLGWIAQAAILPAFKNAKRHSQLVALVSDDRAKLDRLGGLYDVHLLYTYDRYEELLRSGQVDAVYIALPNSMHRDYAVSAARAGVHVLCEKPMAPTVADCNAMIEAARDSKVKLMVAYRLHFEIANLEAIEVVQSGKLGEPRIFDSVFCQNVLPGNTRLDSRYGEDAALFDMGIYCINAARYLFQEEPLEVWATTASRHDPRFRDTGEMTSATMRFPEEKLASFICSYGAAPMGFYEVVGTMGRLRLDPAYDFESELRQVVEIDQKTRERRYRKRDQFGPEIEYFSRCVLDDTMPEPSGLEGLSDVTIIEAMHQSIAIRGQPVRVELPNRRQRPSVAQQIKMPAVSAPPLVNARAPH